MENAWLYTRYRLFNSISPRFIYPFLLTSLDFLMSMSQIPSMKPERDNGILWFNVRDFGAKGDATQDDAPAFQKCIDELFEKQTKFPGAGMATVFVPPSSWGYIINQPIYLDHDNMQIVGGGAGARLVGFGGNPVIYIGVKRRTQLLETFPDAFGILDKSAGNQCGVRLKDQQIQFHSNAFQYGPQVTKGKYDYWENTAKLTIECLVDLTNSSGAWSFGFGSGQAATPFYFAQSGTTCIFCFNTVGSDVAATRFLKWSPPSDWKPGITRVCIQIDLDTPTYSVFYNDLSLPVTYSDYSSIPETYHYGSTFKFTPNDSVPFIINDGCVNDFTVYGFRISNTIRYKNPLASPPKDVDRYFGNDANTIAFLSFNKGSQNLSYTSQNGVVGTTPLLHKDDRGWSKDFGLKNLIINASDDAGQVVSIGPIEGDVKLNDLNISGCTPIASYNIACTYNITMDNCTLKGTDAGFAGNSMIIRANNVTFSGACRDSVRNVTCQSSWDNIFVTGVSTDSVFKFLGGAYGTINEMNRVDIDFEGYYVKTAIVVAENNAYNSGTVLTLKDFYVGTVGDCPVILLRDMAKPGGVFGKAWISVENTYTQGSYSSFVQTDGSLWAGQINGYFLANTDDGKNPLHTHVQRWGPDSNVKFTNVSDYTVVKKDVK